LRKLQHGESLKQLLFAIKNELENLSERTGKRRKPFLVKIAPDLTDEQLDEIVATAQEVGVSGIIATNTTIARPGLTSPHRDEAGGLSGRPLKDRSTAVIRRIYEKTGGQVPIIGVGGIENGDDAYAKIRAGATMVEIYTSFIYGGPVKVREIQERLRELLKKDGFSHVSQAVGIDVRKRSAAGDSM
jgi:dihydroorotate dehydrogenase